MSRIETQYRLDMSGFNRNLDKGVKDVRSATMQMDRHIKNADSGGAMGKKMGAGLSAMRGVAGAAGVGMSAGWIVKTVKESAEAADQLKETAAKLNETATDIQLLDLVAQKAASVGVGQLVDSFVDLEKNLADMDGETVSKALQEIGLSAEELARMTLKEKVYAVSEAFQDARERGVGMNSMMALMGEGVKELAPLLQKSREELDQLFDEQHINLIDPEEIERLAQMKDRLDEVGSAWENVKMHSASAAAEAAMYVVDVFQGGTKNAENKAREREEKTAARLAKEREANQRRRDTAADAFKEKAEAAKQAKESAAAEKAEALTKKSKQAIEDAEFDLLPNDQKLTALKKKLDSTVTGVMGNFPFFENSADGLAELANFEGDVGGAEKRAAIQQSRAEVLKLEKRIRDLSSSIESEKESQSSGLTSLRDKAESLRFDGLSPKAQVIEFQKRLAKSFGNGVGGFDEIAAGLKALSERAAAARNSGDSEAEMKALEQLTEAQGTARNLRGLTSSFEQPTVNTSGTVAGAIEQIFGRDPTVKGLGDIKGVLEKILRLNEEDPPPLEIKIK